MIRHYLRLPILITAGLFILPLFALVQKEEQILAPTEETARYRFGDTRSVGQQFQAQGGLEEISIPMGALEDTSGPLILHIREAYFGDDIRQSALFSLEGREAVFSFSPLRENNRTLIWVLEAPHSPDKSYWVYRELDNRAYLGGSAFVKGVEIPGNFGFRLVRQELLITESWREMYQELKQVSALMRASWVGAVIAGLAAFFWPGRLNITARQANSMIIILAALSLAGHVWYSGIMPVINDEGAYVQDALQTAVDFLPFRDFLTKGPVYIGLLKLWQVWVPVTIMSQRLLSGLTWMLAVWAGGKLARSFRLSPGGQVVTAAALAVLPASIALTTPMLLQVVSVTMVLGGLATCVTSARRESLPLAVFGAVLMSLAYLTRSSSVVGFILGAGVLLMLAKRPVLWLGTYAAVFLALLAGVFGTSWLVMGWEKAVVMFNGEAFLIAGQRAAIQQTAGEPLIRQIVLAASAFWWGAPWLIAGVLAMPMILLKRMPLWGKGVLFSAWGIAVYQIVFHLRDVSYFLPQGGFVAIATILGISFAVPLVIGFLALARGQPAQSMRAQDWQVWALVGAWLALFGGLYGAWGNFRVSYLVEFLPPLALALGWIVTRLNITRTGRGIIVTLIILNAVLGVEQMIRQPHAGTMGVSELDNMSEVVRREVPPGVPIFTAQSAVTAFSTRPIVNGYSHSGWYLSEQVGEVSTELRSLYFADPSAIMEHLRNEAQFVVTDRRTWQVYFAAYPERQDILNEKFELIHEVPSGGSDHPFRLYQRKQATFGQLGPIRSRAAGE